jgi:hypothetical protein
MVTSTASVITPADTKPIGPVARRAVQAVVARRARNEWRRIVGRRDDEREPALFREQFGEFPIETGGIAIRPDEPGGRTGTHRDKELARLLLRGRRGRRPTGDQHGKTTPQDESLQLNPDG